MNPLRVSTRPSRTAIATSWTSSWPTRLQYSISSGSGPLYGKTATVSDVSSGARSRIVPEICCRRSSCNQMAFSDGDSYSSGAAMSGDQACSPNRCLNASRSKEVHRANMSSQRVNQPRRHRDSLCLCVLCGLFSLCSPTPQCRLLLVHRRETPCRDVNHSYRTVTLGPKRHATSWATEGRRCACRSGSTAKLLHISFFSFVCRDGMFHC